MVQKKAEAMDIAAETPTQERWDQSGDREFTNGSEGIKESTPPAGADVLRQQPKTAVLQGGCSSQDADRERGNRKCGAASDQSEAERPLHLLERRHRRRSVVAASVLQSGRWNLLKKMSYEGGLPYAA